MAKYARKKGLHWIDVWRVPEDFADLTALSRCLPGGGFVQVHDGLLHGAAHNDGDGSSGSYTNPQPPPSPAPPPVVYGKLDRGGRLEVLSDVFPDARLNAIHDAFALQTSDALKAAYRKFMSDSYKISRADMTTLLTALRNADIPTAGTKITAAEITAVADHAKWIGG